ncbi:unnamed protein product [Prunus brigantina]
MARLEPILWTNPQPYWCAFQIGKLASLLQQPHSLHSCKSLTAIRLAGNQLRGQILPEIVALKSLAYLSFSSNNLTNVTGALRILMGCKNLTTLTLGKNFGFETLPDYSTLAFEPIFNNYDNVTDPDGFHNLQLLTLEGCQFKGQLPTWLANLKNLQVLDLAFNLITGGLPNMLCGLPVLTSKEAGDDQVERGYLELPIFVMSSNVNNQKYKQLSNLPPTIYLGSNNLSGKIPIEIGQLKFDLSHNHLSGEIPASLKGLHFLYSFSVAHNDLQGLVPTGSQFDTFTTSSFEGNPGLCGPPTLNRSCPQRLQSLPPVYPATWRYNRKKLLVAVIFVISFGISLGIGFRIDAKKIPLVGRCRKYVNGCLLQHPSISCTWKLKPEGQTDKTSIGMVMIRRKDNKATSSKDEKEVPVTPCQRSRKSLLVLLGQWLLLLPYFSSACNQVDHDSLLSLTFKVSSPLNWTGSTDCCLWDGILCDQDDQRVVRLWLPGRGLTGVISPSITNLTHLTHLNLSHNFLSGPLPNDLTLSMLQIVDLSSNFFNGTIPSSFLVPAVAAGSLTTFNVSNNSFSGPIPISLFCTNDSNFNSLSFLDLSFNEFTGQIPPGLGACSKLQVFRAGFNNLSGSLPDDIYDAANLQELSVPVNQLSGVISDGITPLANLKILELFSNQFSGPIPSRIGNLSSLENLLVHRNNLTGPLPPSLMYCTNLSTLNLRFNSFNGDLSAFNFSKLQLLTTVDLGYNNFTGKLPRSLYSCKSLKAIRLSGNQLQGQISPEIVALESLAFLSISRNNLTNATGAFRILMGCKNLTTLVLSKNFLFEPVPGDDSIIDPDGFQNLKVLGLGGCQLTGQLPTWLANLRNLQVLDLTFNRITGSIPSWLGSLPNLFVINLSNNLLTGGFPKELCQMPVFTSKKASDQLKISYLELPIFGPPKDGTSQLYKRVSNIPPAIYVGNNSLSGNIPVEIGRLKFIHVLGLSHNNFSGSIPNQISYLTNLERLDLSYNHLSGEIPSSLKSLHFLSSFSVAYNDLQGLIPSGGQFDTFTISSFEGNPGLCGPPTPKLSCHQSPQSPPQVLEVTQRSKTQTILIALIFGIFFGIGFGTGFSMDHKKFPIIGRRMK